MTNKEWLLERIKSLSDDELAELLCQTELDYVSVDGTSYYNYYNPVDFNSGYCWSYSDFCSYFVEWLYKEHIE